MNSTFNTQMLALVENISRDIVSQLAQHYNFKAADAMKFLNLPSISSKKDTPKSDKKITIPLPFCGKILPNCCHGIRLNHGLYTQCTNEPTSNTYDYPVCKTCEKQCSNSQFNKPTYGFIQERLDKGDNFVDSKGKKPIQYGNIMEKLEISVEQAREAASQLGLEIPEHQFTIEKKTRGRPKKSIAVLDTPSEPDGENTIKRGRGRPKKDKKIITEDNSNDLIEKLKSVAQNEINEQISISSNKDKDDNLFSDSSNNSDADSDEETSVECVKIVGKKLIIIQQNDDGSIPKDTQYLYNSSTKQLFTPSLDDYVNIGTWNGSEIIKNNFTDDSD